MRRKGPNENGAENEAQEKEEGSNVGKRSFICIQCVKVSMNRQAEEGDVQLGHTGQTRGSRTARALEITTAGTKIDKNLI